MPTRRKPLDRAALPRITDEVIDLYLSVRGVSIVRDNLTDAARELYLADYHRLHELLGLGPWMECPTDIEGDEPPDWMAGNPERVERWWHGHRLKQAIEAAAAARRP